MSPDRPDNPAEETPAQPGSGRLAILRRLAVDTTPLRTSPDFRRLWWGQAVSFFGSHMTWVAAPYQVYELTRSPFAVGLLGICQLVALVTMAMVGGALADALDRRRLFRRTEFALMGISILLAANASLDRPRVWAVYVLMTALSGVDALGRPALTALTPRLVPTDQLVAASALNGIYHNFGAIAGPAAGGALVAAFGLPVAYGIDALTFVASLVALTRMAPVPPTKGAGPPGLRSVADGFRFLKGKRVLQATYLIDFNAMIFGMPAALFPALALERFGAGARSVGVLYAAPAAGALVASVLSGPVTRLRRHGLAITLAVVVWGAAVVGLGFAGSLPVAVAMLALAGGADMVSAALRMTIWNTVIPDHMRGRLAGIAWANVAGGPMLGNFEAGVVAGAFGVTFSVVSGGAICIVGAGVLALLMPAFIRYDARRPAP